MSCPGDPSDQVLPPQELAHARHVALIIASWYARQKPWYALTLPPHIEQKREKFVVWASYWQLCSNSKDQIAYLGADVAWACKREEMDRFYDNVQNAWLDYPGDKK